MARTRHNDNPVSLFPFLAVLMCTMGALIFLLIVVSKSIKEDAIAAAKRPAKPVEQNEPTTPKPPATIPVPYHHEVEIPLASLGNAARFPVEQQPVPNVVEMPKGPTFQEIQSQLAEFTKQQQQLESQLDRQRFKMQQLQAEIDRATAEAVKIKNKAQQVDGEFQVALARVQSAKLALATASDDRKRLVQLINESEELADLKKLDNAKASSEFVIVPYDGATGTTRRPIILDCTDDAIRLVGEDISLTPAQLVGYTPITNPLKSGVRELIRFWATWNSVQENPGKEPVPYVMLIVRPSGTVAFYVARKYLQALGADFGYELVEEDFKFTSEKSPDRAVELCRAAILDTLRKKRTDGGRQATSFLESLESDARQQRVRTANIGNGGRAPQGTRGKKGAGGSFDDLTDSGKSMQRWDSREFAKRGTRASQSFFGSDDFKNRQADSSTNSSRQPPNSALSGNGNPRGLPNGSPSGGEIGGQRNARSNADRTANISEFLNRSRNQGRKIEEKLNGRSNDAGSDSNDFNRGPSDPGGERIGSNAGRGADESPQPRLLDRDLIDGQRPLQQRSKSNKVGARSPSQPSIEDRSPFEPINDSSTGFNGQTQSDRTQVSDQKSASSSSNSSNQANAQRNQTGAQGRTSANSNATGNSAMSPSSNAQKPERSAVQSSVQINRSPNRNLHRFKRQWGIQNPNGTIALEKTMQVRLSDKRVVIGGRLQIRITEERLPAQIVEWTIEAIDRVARDWGRPPTRFYWSPAVKLVVEPGGDLMLERMSRTLRQYGVSVEAVYAK
jgi:hypothetical protein